MILFGKNALTLQTLYKFCFKRTKIVPESPPKPRKRETSRKNKSQTTQKTNTKHPEKSINQENPQNQGSDTTKHQKKPSVWGRKSVNRGDEHERRTTAKPCQRETSRKKITQTTPLKHHKALPKNTGIR